MSAGRLFESVAFDEPIGVIDQYGGTDADWAERLTARAGFLNLRGGEAVMASRLEGKQPVVVTIRSHAAALAIDTGWRMRDLRKGHDYNIRSVVQSDDRQFIEITAVRGVAV